MKTLFRTYFVGMLSFRLSSSYFHSQMPYAVLQRAVSSFKLRFLSYKGLNHGSSSVNHLYMSSIASPPSSKQSSALSDDGLFPNLVDSIPKAISSRQLEELINFIHSKKNIICITGAGVSTSSGIPDYRGPHGSYNKGHKPIVHDHYMTNEHARKKYWARSLYGWEKFAHAKPNDCKNTTSL
jgi:hypothetical protein